METKRIGIIMSGVTGRMGTNQHFIRSILAIMKQGGIKVGHDLTLMPEPLLVGRSKDKLAHLAETVAVEEIGRPVAYTTDLDGALKGQYGENEIFFDASGTLQRVDFVGKAIDAGLHVYCEKPTATESAIAYGLADKAEAAGVKNGVVQDKLWLPGLRKLAMLKELGFFGDILSVHGAFGYWVFTGMDLDQPAQRPSWNYRAKDGGGIMIDMFCHWQYVISNLFGEIDSLVALGKTDIAKRRDEKGQVYEATADDSAYAIFELANGIVCQFNSSWAVRVRRDDLLTMEVHGTKGSAVAGLRECRIQSAGNTPKPVWNPDIAQPIDFNAGWQDVPNNLPYDNAFKIQWEEFLRHVALDAPWRYSLREGAKGVELAELGMKSWKDRCWVDVPTQ